MHIPQLYTFHMVNKGYCYTSVYALQYMSSSSDCNRHNLKIHAKVEAGCWTCKHTHSGQCELLELSDVYVGVCD